VLHLYVVLPLFLFALPTALMGFAFPVLQRAVHDEVRSSGRKVGALQAANITGCVAGSLLVGLLALEFLGTAEALRALVGVGLVFAAVGWRYYGRRFAVAALVGNSDRIAAWVSSLDEFALPPPPAWLSSIPLAGDKITAAWTRLAAQGPEGFAAQAAPYVRLFIQWLIAQMGEAGAMILQFLMTVIMCAVLYTTGETAARGVRKFATRLAGPNGDRAALLAAGAIRGVAMGIVVTALVQVLIAGTGLLIASIPGAGLLCAAILLLCLAQLGPGLIMVPAVIWQFSTGSTLSGCILLVFALVSMTIDNVVKPVLIKKGADLPLPLIFAGVIGGMISMGIMGIFLGPVILAVTYNLLKDWVEDRPEREVDADSGAASQTAAKVT
jgi:predicted PurR-regulated permease PerM